MGEAIVITSGKGGVGKSTTTANIGTALALMGKKVCLVDTDIGLRNLDVIMGLENRIIYNIIDVIEGTCKLNQALVVDKRFETLSLLPASQTQDKSAITRDGMIEIVTSLKKEYDYVLIDCPAGIEQGFQNAIAGADQAIVVTTPEKTSVRDADRIIGLLEQEDEIEAPRLLINRIRNHMMETGDMLDVDQILQILSIDLLGIVIDSDDVIKASNEGTPVVVEPDNQASIAYRNIARRILGEVVPLQSLEEQVGMFTKVKRFFGFRT
ncbi:MAG TPA: septum site-determining protein MinD [Pseudogracilibacillus sp.]|nr:septum site-determining protein MinD [Pseudogracilibacillus sp.]